MYCTSSELMTKMRIYIDEIEEKSKGLLTFVEYIALPYFGNIILRFDVHKESYTLADLDTYEVLMQNIVQDAFLVDFMGSVYEKVSFAPWMYEAQFEKCYHKYSDIPIHISRYHQSLQKDAEQLLSMCGLSADEKVWEIQIDDEIAVLILGSKNQKICTYSSKDITVQVFEVEEVSAIGLMRAITYAKMQHISLAHVLLEA